MSNRLPIKEFKSIYSRVPRLCVDLVIVNKAGVVLSKRDIQPWKGYWHLPGGSVYFGETIDKAAKRIAKEELGITVSVKKTLGYAEFLEEVKMANRHTVSIALFCFTTAKESKGSWQAKNVGFFKSLPKPVISTHKKLIKLVLR
jgi:ADP-ribose pyrophosphatase YjhB (NUDIX family)